MKVHILFPFRDGPWGGCNQFLGALRNEFEKTGLWAETPAAADIVLFDSINIPWQVMQWKRRLPATHFVQRIDGPISVYRGDGGSVDRLVYALGAVIADAIVFQSEYSRARNIALGMPLPDKWALVANAPRQDIFYPLRQKKLGGRMRIIATSWSSNANKGFDVYSYLDEHLDFTRYEMTFVGNSPIAFRNIVHRQPQGSSALADELRAHDIFLTASRDDPCSNALLEAMSCGLPVVALSSGGHPEIVGSGGMLFTDKTEILTTIEQVCSNFWHYRQALSIRSIKNVAQDYLRLFGQVCSPTGKAKELSLISLVALSARVVCYRMQQSLARLRSRFSSRWPNLS